MEEDPTVLEDSSDEVAGRYFGRGCGRCEMIGISMKEVEIGSRRQCRKWKKIGTLMPLLGDNSDQDDSDVVDERDVEFGRC